MLSLVTYGEVIYDAVTGAAVVTNHSGDFAVTVDPATQVFEIHFQRDVSKCIVFATAKDPHLKEDPYITVAVQRVGDDPAKLLVGTLNQFGSPMLKPRLIGGFGFWFSVSKSVDVVRPQRRPTRKATRAGAARRTTRRAAKPQTRR